MPEHMNHQHYHESSSGREAEAHHHSHHHHHHHHRRRHKGLKITLIVCSVILALALLAAGAGYLAFHHYFSMMDRLPAEEDLTPSQVASMPELLDEDEDGGDFAAEPATDEEIAEIKDELQKNLEEMELNSELYDTDAFNILLIGVDSRAGNFYGRSDSMILVSINKQTKKVLMTSFLRDIYLAIPGYDHNRLNAAYAYGGTNLLTKTIKNNFGITVDRCLVVNFYVVMDLVNAVGGIDLELTSAEIGYMNNYIKSHNKLLGNPEGTDIMTAADGTYHVNGNQALAYARVRYVGTDFARTGRQRTVITKCLEKIRGMNLGGINALATEFLPRVSTDLTEGDAAMLLLMALSLSDYEFDQLVVPTDGTWNFASIYGMSVITVDFPANSQAWLNKVEGN